jgi:formylglycine-generating enzyme required for sulfatase activity
MVAIPPGNFSMGSAEGDFFARDNERPRHEVAFKEGFRLGRYEVTFEQYCVSAQLDCPDDAGWNRGDRPVINVSWEDANTYIRWLSRITGESFRLPTEAEWEYAARGGTLGRYWWCEEGEPNCELRPDVANCHNLCESTQGLAGLGERTMPVGSFAANPFGLYDITGNVGEWVEDCWHDNYEGAPGDGSAWLQANDGDCTQRVIRGGSWQSAKDANIRIDARAGINSTEKHSNIGFRIAKDLGWSAAFLFAASLKQ